MNKKKLTYRIVLLGYATLVFYLSSLPLGAGKPLLPLPHADKLLHFFEYFLFSWLAAKALSGRHVAITAISLTVLYAATDELHQAFVPSRMPSILDWSADALGAVFAQLLLLVSAHYSLPSYITKRILPNNRSKPEE